MMKKIVVFLLIAAATFLVSSILGGLSIAYMGTQIWATAIVGLATFGPLAFARHPKAKKLHILAVFCGGVLSSFGVTIAAGLLFG